MDPQSPHFGCFAVEKTTIPGSIFVSDIGLGGEADRKRKVHTKSRRGCRNCKIRKVKVCPLSLANLIWDHVLRNSQCNEQIPCQNCIRRNQECSIAVPPKLCTSTTQSQNSIQNISGSALAIPDTLSSFINLEHLRLLHHFQNFTFETFIMEPGTWKDIVMDLALQSPFLMHVVFLVTSIHLQHLQPYEPSHQLVALENLSLALPQFRETLASGSKFEKSHGKALVVCSMLLLQYSWTYDSEGWRSLETFYRGLTSVVLKFIESSHSYEPDSFTGMLAYSPRLHIEGYFENTPISPSIGGIFAHILTCTKISQSQPDNMNDLIEPSRRLMTILLGISLGWQKIEAEGLTLAVARYLFSFPNLLRAGFFELLKKEDERVLVVMLYYFAAVSRLPAERFWWMKERGVYMYKRILEHLGDKCSECTSYGVGIFEGQDLN
jgi:hypothetical protein